MTTRLSVDKHCTSQKPPPISVTLIEHTITKSTDAWNGHYPENGLHWPSKKNRTQCYQRIFHTWLPK